MALSADASDKQNARRPRARNLTSKGVCPAVTTVTRAIFFFIDPETAFPGNTVLQSPQRVRNAHFAYTLELCLLYHLFKVIFRSLVTF